MTDSENPVDWTRRLLDELRSADDSLSALEAQGLESTLYELTGEHPLGTVLEIRFQGARVHGHRAPVSQLSAVITAWQKAVARVGASYTPDSEDEPKYVTEKRLRSYELDALPLLPGSLVVQIVPAVVPEADPGQSALLPSLEPRGNSETERALTALLELFPEEVGPLDEATESSMLAAQPAVRAGVIDIATSVRDSASDITMMLRRPLREVVTARLDRASAGALLQAVDRPVERRENLNIQGVLDGMRTRKRKFWLIADDGHEISGGIPDNLLEAVQRNINQRVSADIEVSWVVGAGRVSRPRYVLDNIGMAADSTPTATH